MLVSGQAWPLQGPVAVGQAIAAASRDPPGPRRQPAPCTASPAAAAHRDRRHNTEGGLDRVDPGADEQGAADGRAPAAQFVGGLGRRSVRRAGCSRGHPSGLSAGTARANPTLATLTPIVMTTATNRGRSGFPAVGVGGPSLISASRNDRRSLAYGCRRRPPRTSPEGRPGLCLRTRDAGAFPLFAQIDHRAMKSRRREFQSSGQRTRVAISQPLGAAPTSYWS